MLLSGPESHPNFKSNKNSQILQTLEHIADGKEALGLRGASMPIGRMTEIVTSIEDFQNAQITATEQVAASDNEDDIDGSSLVLPGNMNTWAPVIKQTVTVGKDLRAGQKILRSLIFPDMKLRLSNIPEAHKQTFAWAYDDQGIDTTPITPWLKTGDGVFWVTGKAGSGKSTFMKHLSVQAESTALLTKWAGDSRKLIVGSFFFWNAGSELQKSQKGLLQTLLFQILLEYPSLIPTVCPERWRPVVTTGTVLHDQWTLMELLQTLSCVLEQDLLDAAFCFFIDGLDEYRGDPFEIIKLLRKISGPSIKMCLSSRPWNFFDQAFGKDSTRYIRLEEHNRNDINTYVHDMIATSPDFKALQREDATCNSLIDEIVDRAQGVFLWVFLIVRSLIRGLCNGDTVQDLQNRLRQFPQELEPYFQHMISSIDDVYRMEMAELLQISVRITLFTLSVPAMRLTIGQIMRALTIRKSTF
jgi:hypothetical protein